MANTMPPLAVESSLVRTMPVRPADSWKACAWARPFWPVVASSTKSDLRLRVRQPLGDRAPDLGQLVHQVALGVQPAGGVDDDDVACRARRPRRARRRPRPTGRRPAACATTGTSMRSAQISSCSMAAARNVSAAASSTRAPRVCEAVAELGDGGRLAGAVDADHQDDGGHVRRRLARPRRRIARREQAEQLVPATRQLGSAGRAARAPARRRSMASARADVGRDERLLDLLPRRVVDRRRRSSAAQPRHEATPAALEPASATAQLVGRSGSVPPRRIGCVVDGAGPSGPSASALRPAGAARPRG